MANVIAQQKLCFFYPPADNGVGSPVGAEYFHKIDFKIIVRSTIDDNCNADASIRSVMLEFDIRWADRTCRNLARWCRYFPD
jgi:hypothetical protein